MGMSRAEYDELTPQETEALVRAVRQILDAEAEERIAHTTALMRALGARVVA